MIYHSHNWLLAGPGAVFFLLVVLLGVVNGVVKRIDIWRNALRIIALGMIVQHLYFVWFKGEFHEMFFIAIWWILVASIKPRERFFFQGSPRANNHHI